MVRLPPSDMSKPSSKNINTDPSLAVFFCGFFSLFVFHVCQAVLPGSYSLVGTCWERAELLAYLYVMYSCIFVTFPYSILRQVWHLIESVPDLCLLFDFCLWCLAFFNEQDK